MSFQTAPIPVMRGNKPIIVCYDNSVDVVLKQAELLDNQL